jgi:hypothetical protein
MSAVVASLDFQLSDTAYRLVKHSSPLKQSSPMGTPRRPTATPSPVLAPPPLLTRIDIDRDPSMPEAKSFLSVDLGGDEEASEDEEVKDGGDKSVNYPPDWNNR